MTATTFSPVVFPDSRPVAGQRLLPAVLVLVIVACCACCTRFPVGQALDEVPVRNPAGRAREDVHVHVHETPGVTDPPAVPEA